MGVAPAEPLCYRATELALVLDEVHAMRFAIFHSTTYAHSCTFSTNQLLFFEVLIIILCGLTVFHATEVRFVTFVALVVR